MGVDNKKMILTATELRRHAEEQLKTKSSATNFNRTSNETQRLLHELQVHQIELEMQNEVLKETRNELEMSLEKYSDLFDFAPMGYFTLDSNEAISAVNFAGARLLGIECIRLLGRRFGQFVTKEYRTAFADFLEKVFISSAKETCELILLKGGNPPLFVQIEGLATASGEDCRIALIDITQRKQAEKELELLNKTLEARVVEMVADSRRKDQSMIQQNSLAAMGEMISNIAHQWRNPLNNVALIIQNLQGEYDHGTLTSEDMHRDINDAMEVLLHMSQTIDDFRSFFRIDKEKRGFLISEAVGRAMSLVSASLENHNIQVEIKTDDDVTVFGYQNEYSQVLLNMFSNVCNICCERDVANSRIFIHITQENEHSVLYIRDNCGGIPDDVMPKIFDPYFTTRGPDKGTGIGLYMSKIIIEQNMDGQLTARNVNGGAEFRIEV